MWKCSAKSRQSRHSATLHCATSYNAPSARTRILEHVIASEPSTGTNRLSFRAQRGIATGTKIYRDASTRAEALARHDITDFVDDVPRVRYRHRSDCLLPRTAH